VAVNKQTKKQPVIQPKKKRKHHKQNRPEGHFCYVCGENKANEKFSGRGHANHICGACQSLPQAERNEMIAVRKIGNMAFRYLSDTEIKWLRGKMNDSRPEVREAAREAHAIKFPHYERNMMKKGLTTRSLEFFIHGAVWDEYGDEMPAHMRFFANNTGAIRRIDYSASEGEQETSINIGQQTALKFLKAVVHQLNAPFWSEDLCDAGPDEYDPYDPYLDILPECRPDYGQDITEDENFEWALYIDGDDDLEKSEGPETLAGAKEPIWSLKLALTKGYGEKTQTFYNQMHQDPQDLFWSLMELFQPDDDEFDDEVNNEFDDKLDDEFDDEESDEGVDAESNLGAVCEICEGDMLKVDGCKPSVIMRKGIQYPRIKVGDKGDFYENGGEDTRCGDCGAKFGYYHHEGCDSERCPVCGGQLLSCGCGQRVVYMNIEI